MSNDSTALAQRTDTPGLMVSPQMWQTMRSHADMLVKTGFLPTGVNTAEKALAIMVTGYELGIPMMTALRTIHVIEGKPTLSAGLMQALILKAHGEDALVFIPEDSGEDRATYQYKRRGWSTPKRYTYTLAMARAAGLIGTTSSGKPNNWMKFPGPMCRSRCVTAIAIANFQDVILGLYTPDELGAPVVLAPDGDVVYDASADVVDASFTESPAPASTTTASTDAAPASNGTAPRPERSEAGKKAGADVQAQLARLYRNGDKRRALVAAFTHGRELTDLSDEKLGKLAEGLTKLENSKDADDTIKLLGLRWQVRERGRQILPDKADKFGELVLVLTGYSINDLDIADLEKLLARLKDILFEDTVDRIIAGVPEGSDVASAVGATVADMHKQIDVDVPLFAPEEAPQEDAAIPF